MRQRRQPIDAGGAAAGGERTFATEACGRILAAAGARAAAVSGITLFA